MIKGLSIQQPWPWLILRPDLTTKEERLEAARKKHIKDVENRRWKYLPSYRGTLAIHASQTFDMEGWHFVRETFPDIPLPGVKPNGTAVHDLKALFRTGGFVGKVYMNDSVWEDSSPWFAGGDCIALKFRMPKPMPFIPYKGQLNFFRIDDQTAKKIERA